MLNIFADFIAIINGKEIKFPDLNFQTTGQTRIAFTMEHESGDFHIKKTGKR